MTIAILIAFLLFLIAGAVGLVAWVNSSGATGYTGGAIAQKQVASGMDQAMGLDGPAVNGQPSGNDPGLPVDVQVQEPAPVALVQSYHGPVFAR